MSLRIYILYLKCPSEYIYYILMLLMRFRVFYSPMVHVLFSVCVSVHPDPWPPHNRLARVWTTWIPSLWQWDHSPHAIHVMAVVVAWNVVVDDCVVVVDGAVVSKDVKVVGGAVEKVVYKALLATDLPLLWLNIS